MREILWRNQSRRLHLQIFRALVMTGLLCLLVAAGVGALFRDQMQRWPSFVEDVGAFLVADLPAGERHEVDRELRRRAAQLHASIALWDHQGRLLGSAGRALGPELLAPSERKSAFDHDDHSIRVRLSDGRTLAIAFNDRSADFGMSKLMPALCLLFVTLLFGSYLAARHITRRLEQLERGVTRFGAGELDVRVEVCGRDEIASLASAFNRSFDRIAGLLKQQRRMLQSASHELRSPLARVRMALELATEPELASDARERLRHEATRDIEELDALIGDLLLAGRLADTELTQAFAVVPLRPIVESEAERVGAQVAAADLQLAGDARMLRSLVRNLLENARRYGRDPIRALLSREGSELVLRVEDAGDGVAPEERERIFEAFYRPVGHREGADGGVGLGLALVKTIAEHHRGSVRYVVRERGSCFEVRLPCAPDAGSEPR